MDYVRKFLGIPPPQRYNDGYFYWGPYFGEGTHAQEDSDVEVFDVPLPSSPVHPHFHQEQHEYEGDFRDVERQFQEIFGQQPGFFSQIIPRIFEDFDHQQVPAIESGPKSDVALDNRALNSESLLAIMEEDRNNRQLKIAPKQPQIVTPFSRDLPTGFKSFSRSISVQTTQKPDGTWETRKIVRDGDGNEKVTVTEHPPSDGPSFPRISEFGADPFASSYPEQDKRGTGFFNKMFGGF